MKLYKLNHNSTLYVVTVFVAKGLLTLLLWGALSPLPPVFAAQATSNGSKESAATLFADELFCAWLCEFVVFVLVWEVCVKWVAQSDDDDEESQFGSLPVLPFNWKLWWCAISRSVCFFMFCCCCHGDTLLESTEWLRVCCNKGLLVRLMAEGWPTGGVTEFELAGVKNGFVDGEAGTG